jgi:hypothetical protein
MEYWEETRIKAPGNAIIAVFWFPSNDGLVKSPRTCHCEELAAQALAQRAERRSNLTK